MARIAMLQSAFAPPAPQTPSKTLAAPAGGDSSFAGMLQGAMGPGGAAATAPMAPVAGAGGPGAAIVAAAAGEVGQAEQPPGSNDSPRIAQYRSAPAGAPRPGPRGAQLVA